MENRQEELCKLHEFVRNIDTELTLLLQHLQWDTKQLLESKSLVCCKYDNKHMIPGEMLKKHEKQCLLNCNGYLTDDLKLPDPLDENANTLIKFDKTDITHIISAAAEIDPLFKKVGDMEPLSLDRLQATYTPDERRAIHDAVVKAAPFCHDLSDLALPSVENGETNTSSKQKSRVEILAELRNMRRRRTKYRVAAKTRNYSDVLRDVIKTQMEVYSDIKVEGNINPISAHGKTENNLENNKSQSHRYYRNDNKRQTEESRSYENNHKFNKDRQNDFGNQKRDEKFREYKYSSSKLSKNCDGGKKSEQRDYGQRKRKKEGNDEDRGSSYKKSKTHKLSEGDNTKSKKYEEIECKERHTGDRSSSYTRDYDKKHDADYRYKDHGDKKYYKQEMNSHSSRHKSSSDSSKYKSENNEHKHRKDKRESSSEKGKYRTEKHSSRHISFRSDREDKHVAKRYYDDY